MKASFDVATGIDVFRLGAVSNKLVLQMVEACETALNIKFEGKDDIVEAASGSLYIAQHLCYNICVREGIETIRLFALPGGFGDSTCLKLLELLAKSEYGFLSLSNLKARRPDLVKGLEYFIDKDLMEILYHECPDSRNFLWYDKIHCAIIIDDPQMTFYLRKLLFSELAQELGLENY